MNETWRPIPGYEGRYEVSNMGRVKSLSRPLVIAGRTYRLLPDRIMQLHVHNNGYAVVWLRIPGSHKKFYVHRLVAYGFIPMPAGKEVVNHKDRDRRNNSLENLEWLTFQENTAHWQDAERARIMASNRDF